MELVIVTGMSGAGKSQAVRALEDIGYYCVDNMPPQLILKFVELCSQSGGAIRRVALVMDVRGGEMFSELQHSLASLTEAGQGYRVLFLDCADAVLCRRFKETRRRHPLAGEGESVESALTRERALLAPVLEKANYRLDTTLLSTSQLKTQITSIFMGDQVESMAIQCMSFGFKYGFPAEADLMLDVRCFPNPFYIPELKHQTGLDKPVQDFVLGAEDTRIFLRHLYAMLDHLIPLYIQEGKTQLVVAVGCTGGKHRSVTIANALAEHIRSAGHRVLINHRDIEKV